jgi:predicted glycosyltransferase
MRILYHAINGSGLGHLTRLGAIAAAVQQEAPDVHQLVATSANYPHLLEQLRTPYIVLPRDISGPLLAADRRLRSVSAGVAYRILRETIRAYDPKVVVFDTHAPRALVEECRAGGRHAVLVLRQCRDEAMERMLRDGTLSAFAAVLLPHAPAELRAILSRGTLRPLESLPTVRYVGGIVFPAPIDAAAIARVCERHGLTPEARPLLICAGSGAYTAVNRRFVEAACRAAAALAAADRRLRVVCVAGPYANTLSDIPGCRVVQSEPDLQALMARAELVIAHAGYNTVQEVLRTGARAVLVPTYRRSEDQGALVRALMPRPALRLLEPDAPEGAFRAASEQLLRERRPPRVATEGALSAARGILEVGGIPDLYICCRAPASTPGPGRVVPPSHVSRALTSSTSEARLCIDWDLVHGLFDVLDETARHRLISVEVDLGTGDPDELAERAYAVHDLLRTASIDLRIVTFALHDSMAGRCLALLAERIAGLEFRTLVAHIPQRNLHARAIEVFEAAEFCRSLPARFTVDITVVEHPISFVDQV